MRKNAEIVSKQDAELRTRLAQQYLERGAKLCASSNRQAGKLWLMRAFDTVDPEEVGRTAATRALTLLDSVPAPTGRIPLQGER